MLRPVLRPLGGTEAPPGKGGITPNPEQPEPLPQIIVSVKDADKISLRIVTGCQDHDNWREQSMGSTVSACGRPLQAVRFFAKASLKAANGQSQFNPHELFNNVPQDMRGLDTKL